MNKRIPSRSWPTETLGGVARALAVVVAWCAIGAFLAVTAVSILWKFDRPPLPGLDAAAAMLPGSFYGDMLGMEVAGWRENRDEPSSFAPGNVASFLTRLTTGVDPRDPRTLTAQLLPGAREDVGIILVRGIGTGPSDVPVEVAPAPHLQDPPTATAERQPGDAGGLEAAEGGPSGAPGEAEGGEASGPDGGAPGAQVGEHAGDEPREPAPNVVFVYHSHPEESFLPELSGVTEVDEAFEKTDKSKTVTAVGKYLADELRKRGVGAVHSDVDYPWRTAYTESRKTVKAAMQKHRELEYFIDIHRDSARKEKTVLTHNGATYAKLYFVIGQKNPNYEQNEKLANELHYRIEEKVRGLSRGVVEKNVGSNGEFNQSLSPNSILVEVGGVDNTMEECYRTVELLAEVLADIYWENAEAVEANAPAAEPEASPGSGDADGAAGESDADGAASGGDAAARGDGATGGSDPASVEAPPANASGRPSSASRQTAPFLAP